MENDFQLKLVENYLLKLRYTSDMKSKNNIDFGYLIQRAATRGRTKQNHRNRYKDKSDLSSCIFDKSVKQSEQASETSSQ